MSIQKAWTIYHHFKDKEGWKHTIMELLGSPAISQYHLVSFCAYPFCLTVSTQTNLSFDYCNHYCLVHRHQTFPIQKQAIGAWNLHEFKVQTRSDPLIQTSHLKAEDKFSWLLLWYMELPSLGFGMIWDSPCTLPVASRVSNTRTIHRDTYSPVFMEQVYLWVE